MKKQPRRQYTPEEKAEALALYKANGENLKRTVREFRTKDGQPVPEPTMRRWVHGQVRSGPSPELQAQKITDLGGGLRSLVFSLIGLAAEKVDEGDASLLDIFKSLGIAFDKLQMLEGGPTERVAVVDERLTDAERSARVAALFDAARARGARPVADRSDWAD